MGSTASAAGGAMDAMIHSSTFLLPGQPSDGNGPLLKYALIILNHRLPRFTPLLWQHARMRVCADGGANRLHDQVPLLFPDEDAVAVRKRYVPDVIKGDLDSIREEVLGFYKNLGTEVVDASHDQDTTDLHKCILHLQNNDMKNLCILVAGALGGRFDHEMGNVNVLCHFSSMRIVLLSDDCLIRLLPSSHRHEILILSAVEGPHCGLIPISGPSQRNTTTGLQWNLADTEMRFGGLISTSNLVKEEVVTVQSDTDLLWTISLKRWMDE